MGFGFGRSRDALALVLLDDRRVVVDLAGGVRVRVRVRVRWLG